MSKKTFWLLVVVSSFVQILLSLLETYGDVSQYFVPWAQTAMKYGFSGFYERSIPHVGFANYPPLVIYILTAFYAFGGATIKPFLGFLWQLNILFPFFPSGIVTFLNKDNIIIYSLMKLPNIAANIMLGIGLYLLAKKLTKAKSKLPEIIFVSTLFNPALIFLSAMWGQVDVLPFAFIIWSFYFLVKKLTVVSVLFMTTALLAKQTGILVLPFYLLVLLNNIDFKRLWQSAVAGYLVFIAFFWPFQKTMPEKLFPFSSYLKIASKFGSDMTTMHAHNLWGAIAPSMKDHNFRLVSQLVVGAFLIFVLTKTWGQRKNLPRVFASFAVFGFFSFMFMTRMHERHLFVIIPFFLLASVVDFKFYWLFIFGSLYLFVNMYAAWPVPRIGALAYALNYQPVVVAIVVVGLAGLFFAIMRWMRLSKAR